jgi:hypothetical protein
MRGGWWVAAAMMASTLLVSHVAHAECTKDFDCEGELICEEGRCVTAPPPPSPAAPPRVAPAAPTVVRSIGEERPRFFDDTDATKRPRVRRRFKHPGLLVVGIVTTSAGVLLSMSALLSSACELGNCRDTSTREALLLASLGAIGVGVPMIVFGAKRENAPSVALTPWVMPGQGGLRLQLHL